MGTDKLAQQMLIETEDAKIVSSFSLLSDPQLLKLAFAVKETCYNSWTKKPILAQKSANILKLLSTHTSSDEIEAIAFWIEGIADLTRGKIQEAIDNLENANSLFLDLGKEHLAAQTQISRLYGLALLGKYDEAIVCGKSALEVFKNNGDELAAGKIEHNFGNIFMRREKYKEAEKYLIAAQKRFYNLKDFKQLTMVENALAITLTMQNRFHEAENVYKKALVRAEKSKMLVTRAEIEANMGNLALFRAKYDQALRFLELSRQKFDQLDMPHQKAMAELEMADAYFELNLVQEAFDKYKNIVEILAELKMQGEEARARANYARAAISLREVSIAVTQLTIAEELYFAENNSVGVAFVKLIDAQLSITNLDYENSLALTTEAIKLLKSNSDSHHFLTAQWLNAESLLHLGKNKKAADQLEQLFKLAKKREAPQIAQLAKISLGKTSINLKNFGAAEKHFKEAIKLIETLRNPLPAEEFRIKYLSDKLIPYQELTKIYLSKNQLAEALRCVERFRSRSLSEVHHNRVGFVKKEKNITTEMSSRLRVLRESLNWSYRYSQQSPPSENKEIYQEITNKEKEITQLIRRINNTSGTGVNKKGLLDVVALQTELGENSVLIEYVIIDNRISAFIITDKNIEFVRNFAKIDDIDTLLKKVQFQMETMRYSNSIIDSFGETLKKKADYYLARLYEMLLRPLDKFIENRNLIVVPTDLLFYVPFHALKRGKHYVIEDAEVSYSPSASLFLNRISQKKENYQKALLIGFADEKNPSVYDEIGALKKIFPESHSFIEQCATLENLKRNAGDADILHFACHGSFRKDNPTFSSLKLSDGWITVGDIYDMELNCDLVTLSACESGRSQIFEGDELLGLARGFLHSGARSLLVALWTINDSYSSRFMKGFYKNLRDGKTITQSLRKIQREFINEELHPYYWSPFFLIGK